MRKKLWIIAALLLVLPAFLFTVSCAKKPMQKQPAAPTETAAQEVASDKAPAMSAEEQAKAEAERARLAARNLFERENVHYTFDSSALDAMAQSVLKRKAEWLMDNPNAAVVIEGHCDERGTVEYNLALGERRSVSAQAFLTNLGIDAARLITVSYGEERPLDPGSNEEAWAKNRRAQFVIK